MTYRDPAHDDHRTVVRLITDVIGEFSVLLQNELDVLRAEVNEKISRFSNAGVMIAMGAVASLAALFLLLQAIVKWLAVAGLPEEWGYLILGVIAAAVAAAVLLKGLRDIRSTSPVPRRALRQLGEDIAAVKEHVI
jgi:hypothetical protein